MAIRRAQGAKLLDQLHERLEAAEARATTLAQELDAVRQELAGRDDRAEEVRRELLEQLAGTVETLDATVVRVEADTAARIEALSSATTTNHRRHAGFIDVLRRSQKAMDERLTGEGTERRGDVERIHRLIVEQSTRLTEASDRLSLGAQQLTGRLDAVTADAEELRQRAARHEAEVATRIGDELTAARQAAGEREDQLRRAVAGQLEELRRSADERFLELDGFRSDLATILDRIGATLEGSHETVSQLLGRVDALETTVRLHGIEVGAVAHHYETARADLDRALGELEQLAAAAAVVEQELHQTTATVAQLADIPGAVSGMRQEVTVLGDRVTAAELLLNQRDDLELQLDRAEEFERTLVELNPDRYATREALEELRVALDELRSVDHDA